jgi:hypothetical protein
MRESIAIHTNKPESHWKNVKVLPTTLTIHWFLIYTSNLKKTLCSLQLYRQCNNMQSQHFLIIVETAIPRISKHFYT